MKAKYCIGLFSSLQIAGYSATAQMHDNGEYRNMRPELFVKNIISALLF